MNQDARPLRIFISVAEESADVHAAALVRVARSHWPGCEFYGLTGPRLRALDVGTVYDFASHAAMLAGVLGVIRQARQAVRAVVQSWRDQPPDLVVLLDSPELHLRLARRAQKLGLPVLYYIAPQTWASRAGRNKQIVRDIDRLACILPFEEEYFRTAAERYRRSDSRFEARYVGHPLFESLRQRPPVPDAVALLKARAAGRPVVALLPGSRKHVIAVMLPRQLEIVRRLRAGGLPVYAAISCVSEERRQQMREHLATAGLATSGTPDAPGDGLADVGIDIVVDDNASLLTAADLTLVASGTAALHVAHYRTPMIVMYDAGRLLSLPYRLLGRYVIKTPHLSLVNILAGARVVPEFMPFIRDVGPIATLARQLLTDETWRRVMVRQIDEVVRPLEASDASAAVCRLMGELLGEGARGPRG